MKLQNTQCQMERHPYYRADGTITTGGTAQLILGQSIARSSLFIQNLSNYAMYVEIGVGAGYATLTNGAVTSVTVTNVGFNFTKPPLVRFLGGGYPVTGVNKTHNHYNTAYVGLAQPNAAAPQNIATGVATLTSSSVSGSQINGVTITNGGANYAVAPYVMFMCSDLDPMGVALPSPTSGAYLSPGGGSVTYNGTVCPTDPVAIYCATTGAAFICRYTD